MTTTRTLTVAQLLEACAKASRAIIDPERLAALVTWASEDPVRFAEKVTVVFTTDEPTIAAYRKQAAESEHVRFLSADVGDVAADDVADPDVRKPRGSSPSLGNDPRHVEKRRARARKR
jgi:hypothetical protein